MTAAETKYYESIGRLIARAELLLDSIKASPLAPCPACHRFAIGCDYTPMHGPGCPAVSLREALDAFDSASDARIESYKLGGE